MIINSRGQGPLRVSYQAGKFCPLGGGKGGRERRTAASPDSQAVGDRLVTPGLHSSGWKPPPPPPKAALLPGEKEGRGVKEGRSRDPSSNVRVGSRTDPKAGACGRGPTSAPRGCRALLLTSLWDRGSHVALLWPSVSLFVNWGDWTLWSLRLALSSQILQFCNIRSYYVFKFLLLIITGQIIDKTAKHTLTFYFIRTNLHIESWII